MPFEGTAHFVRLAVSYKIHPTHPVRPNFLGLSSVPPTGKHNVGLPSTSTILLMKRYRAQLLDGEGLPAQSKHIWTSGSCTDPTRPSASVAPSPRRRRAGLYYCFSVAGAGVVPGLPIVRVRHVSNIYRHTTLVLSALRIRPAARASARDLD
jgi:hypothetical protein